MPQAFATDLVSYSAIRQTLAAHLDQCAKRGKRFQIMRNGKPQGILLSTAEWEQMSATLDILTNPKIMDQLMQSEKDIKKGRVHTLDDAFRGLLDED
jgi:PHD/YefM family antitoxin component YafN of YafNO toxin-antitoxin module